MLKRILTTMLAASMLAASAASVAAATDSASLATDSCAPVCISDGVAVIDSATNANELLACFVDRSGVSIVDAEGNTLSGTDLIPSGATVRAGDESAVVVLPGDVNGDAKISTRDVIAILRSLVGMKSGFIPEATDVDQDGSVNVKDVIKLMRAIVGWDEFIGAAHEKAPSQDDSLSMYFTTAMLRVERGDTKNYGTPDGISYMAKNEIESVQFVITSAEAKKGLTVEVGELASGSGKTLPYELRYGYYYKLELWNDLNSGDITNYNSGYYTDPYPTLKDAFDIDKNESRSFMIRVTASAEADAGWYSAPVVVRDSAGNEIERATLRVYVWDFALDAAPACRTLINTWSYGIAGYFHTQLENFDDAGWADFFAENWYDYMLENKISGYTLPYAVLDNKADKYMSDPRVTAYCTAGAMASFDWTDSENRTELQKIYNKLQTNPEWADKAYIYTVDEPWGASGYQIMVNQWNNAKETLGDTPFKVITPFGNDYIQEYSTDLFELLVPYCNTFCPGAGVFTRYGDKKMQQADPINYPTWGEYTDYRVFKKHGRDFEERYNEVVNERGDDRWWYICVGPCYPYANFFNSYQGAWARVVFWEQFRYDIDGFLYWDTCMWNMGEHDGRLINLKRTNGGDGLLIYPGTLWGEGTYPVPTARFEAVRDGIEDFQYLRQLERLIGYDEVKAKYNDRITTDVVIFTKDWHDISSVREEMGFELERAN